MNIYILIMTMMMSKFQTYQGTKGMVDAQNLEKSTIKKGTLFASKNKINVF